MSTVKRVDHDVLGLGLLRERHTALWSLIYKLASELGATPPKYVIAGLDPTFFVSESPVRCLNGRSTGRILYLSLPLCRILTPGELSAVIGHELGHYRGGDLWFSRRFYPIFRGTASSLDALHDATDDLIHAIPLLPSISILTLFYDAFSLAESKISRDRELAADRCGVAASDAQAMGTALAKLTAHWPAWERCLMLLRRQARSPRSEICNASAAFVERVRESAESLAIECLANDSVSHPLDSHPPLQARLAAIGLTVDDIHGAVADSAPVSAAIDLIADAEALEQELSEALFARLRAD